ncbi:MAG TPA: hypothetical protein VKE93_01600 [Candidatus Angelobacter sp.]|nr:hypothetical protein [Candidatus Angelobacter sp.]
MNDLLLCVGPERFRSTFMQNWESDGERVLFVTEERPQSPGSIARLESYCRTAAADKVSAVLLLVPKRCSPQKALPGPTIGGLPAGLMPADQPEDLEAWLEARRQKTAGVGAGIMAMWRRSYLSLGARFHRWLEAGSYGTIENWFANEMNCHEVCRRIAAGARLVLYLGHGRSEGLSAYLGLRWSDVVAVRKFRPCCSMIAFACDTVKRETKLPFGCRMVCSARALSYFGSTAAVPLRANAQLASLAGQQFAGGRVRNLAELVRGLDAMTQTSPRLQAARQAFQSFRIIGNPLEQFA